MRLMQENRRSREDSVLKGGLNEQSKRFDLVESVSARRAENGELSAQSHLHSNDSEDDEYVPDSEDSSSDEDDDSEEDYNEEDTTMTIIISASVTLNNKTLSTAKLRMDSWVTKTQPRSPPDFSDLKQRLLRRFQTFRCRYRSSFLS